ncbi:MAG: patatin-like phospholipase family protein [Myxococcaceae bacterium]|nr:patatin-like phospholipase family protein [Myxococcaceae bacterium]
MSTDNRAFIKQLAHLECQIVREQLQGVYRITDAEEAILRWALSLARVSQVWDGGWVPIGTATDLFRTRLYETLIRGRQIGQIQSLLSAERERLLLLYRGRMSETSLDAAVQTRPLGLALSGGGGTSYVFIGAFAALEEAGIRPDAIAGSSMGAILGLYRAFRRSFDLEEMKRMGSRLQWNRLISPTLEGSQFGFPATFRLNLDVLREPFRSPQEPRTLALKELPIPLRVAVSGIADSQWRGLDVPWFNPERALRNRKSSLVKALVQFAKRPLKAIYLGGDELTAEFDVLDAVGFSAAVPGLFHYEVCPQDASMLSLVREMMRQHGVSRLMDGGFSDNLPAAEARRSLVDPFVLSLDGFSPNWKRHWMFLPMMAIAAETSKEGYEASDCVIAYHRVLSPMKVVPSPQDLLRAIQHGRAETEPHIPFLKKMLQPLKNPWKETGTGF